MPASRLPFQKAMWMSAPSTIASLRACSPQTANFSRSGPRTLVGGGDKAMEPLPVGRRQRAPRTSTGNGRTMTDSKAIPLHRFVVLTAAATAWSPRAPRR